MYLKSNIKSECSGCGACSNVCSKGAITMQQDEEWGHFYPLIDNEKCVNCNLCQKVCPSEDIVYTSSFCKKAYVGKSSDSDQSASGGGLGVLSELLASNGYIVYGVKYDENLNVIHDCATTIDECKPFRKSKYVQSFTNKCYSKIADDLKKNHKVFFTGVSCQCEALIKYLAVKRIPINNLVIANILCHGVTSQKMFDTYRKEQEQKLGKRIVTYQFRNKKQYRGKINSRTAEIIYSDASSKIVGIKDDAFLSFYYRRLGYRPSCYECRFTVQQRVSDLTFADAWNYEKVNPKYDPVSGVSLMLANTNKGLSIIELLHNVIKFDEIPNEWAMNSQGLFKHPTSIHPHNKDFYSIYKKKGFEKAVFSITQPNIFSRLINKIKKIIQL